MTVVPKRTILEVLHDRHSCDDAVQASIEKLGQRFGHLAESMLLGETQVGESAASIPRAPATASTQCAEVQVCPAVRRRPAAGAAAGAAAAKRPRRRAAEQAPR